MSLKQELEEIQRARKELRRVVSKRDYLMNDWDAVCHEINRVFRTQTPICVRLLYVVLHLQKKFGADQVIDWIVQVAENYPLRDDTSAIALMRLSEKPISKSVASICGNYKP